MLQVCGAILVKGELCRVRLGCGNPEGSIILNFWVNKLRGGGIGRKLGGNWEKSVLGNGLRSCFIFRKMRLGAVYVMM